MFGLGVALLTFTSLALAGYAVTGWMSEREQSRQGMARRLATAGVQAMAPADSILKDQRVSRIAVVNKVLERMKLARPLVRQIGQAGLRKRSGEIVLSMPLLALVAVLLIRAITGNLVLGLVIGILAGVSPLLMVRRARDKRARLFGEQLPDALDLIRAALQAGQGLQSAFVVVAEEFPEPMGSEMHEVSEQMRLGMSLREALYGLVERIDEPNIPILVVGILVAQEVGGNLAEVLDSISYTIRERFKILRDAHVMTTQGRMQGLLLTALPILVGLATALLNPGYFAPMLQSRLGQYMLAYAVASVVLGHFVIQRIVRIRV